MQIEKNHVTQQLAEKEILMQEVHHRVKNNLTFLKSLLYLRSTSTNDPDVKLILDECQAQIQSIALVHQKLYDVDDATKIDFDFFIRELFEAVESMIDSKEISLDINAHKIMIDMKLSVFLGLIINEMLTNSFKYAFAEGNRGEICVQMEDFGNEFELKYSDNGKGFPEGFDFNATSGFGFKLINILLNQIDARLSYVKETSSFEIRIPK